MAAQRLLQAKPGILSVTLTDGTGEAAAATGAVTVAVVSAAGTQIVAAGTGAAAGSGVGVYQLAVTATQTAALGQWTATWTDAGTGATQTTYHEICGGYFFSVAEARAYDSALADTVKYPDALIQAKRQMVEDEAEYICDVPFVPRYRRVLLDGTAEPELYLPDSKIRSIVSATIFTAFGTGQVTLTTPQLANLVIDEDFRIERNDGGIWDEGKRNIVIEYTAGWDAPPAELKDAALLRLRSVLNRATTIVPNRATSFVAEGGVTYRLDTAAAFKTGIPDVDAVYDRYSTREFDDQEPYPASHQMVFDPQWFSVYHGGRR